MCPEQDGPEDEHRTAQAASSSDDVPVVCWGQDTLAARRKRRPVLNGRSVAVLGGLVLAAGAAGITMASRGGGGASATVARTPLTQAAYVTAQAPGFKFELSMTGTLGSHSFTFDGAGSIDERKLEGTMNLQLAGESVAEIIKNPYVYVHLPSGSAGAGGKRWVEANIDTYSEALGASGPLGGNTTGPTQMLSFLKASGQVSTLGEQRIGGVTTTHYHALVDFSRYASLMPSSRRAATERYAEELQRITGSSSLPIDVWVDAHQRVRRFLTSMQICTPQGALAESLTMNLYDYGPQPAVLAPAPSEVSEITSQLTTRTSQALQQLSC